MKRGKISVVINTYNAEKHLEEVLQSVAEFDEVLICDMQSTDRTLEIAEKYGARVITFERGNCVSAEPARTFAIQSAMYHYVLVVDADELVPPALKERLYRVIEDEENAPHGIYIPRKNYFLGRFMKSLYPDYQLRFFIKEGTRWPEFVHTFPTIQGRTERLDSKNLEEAFIHLSDDSIFSRLEKTNRYTENEVMKKASKHYGIGALVFRPLWAFFRTYIQKAGFRDGMQGFIYCCLDAIYRFITVAKIIEHHQKSKGSK